MILASVLALDSSLREVYARGCQLFANGSLASNTLQVRGRVKISMRSRENGY